MAHTNIIYIYIYYIYIYIYIYIIYSPSNPLANWSRNIKKILNLDYIFTIS